MPLIRYKTTDILTIKRYTEANRHKFTEVEKIQGRVNDKIVTSDGREFYFMGVPVLNIPGIIASQFIQHKIDKVNVKLLTDKDFNMESIAQVKRNLTEYADGKVVFDVEIVDQFEERGRGKRPVIISRLN